MIQLQGAEVLPALEPPAPRQPDKPKSRSKATRDRFGVLNGFVDCSMAELSRAELTTWLILYRDTRNGTAATAQADIARRGGIDIGP